LSKKDEEKQQHEEKHSQRFLYLPPHYATINTTNITIIATWSLAC
jgi:hypothetical protein